MMHLLRRAGKAVMTTAGGRAVAPPEIPYQAWNQPPTMVTRLSNGIRVATQRTSDSEETATVGVWIDSGSRYETKNTNGAAHFLEHMAFKGTRRRNRVQLEQEIENMGAHLNAYTAREQTVYYAKAFRQDVPQCLDILADILTNSVYDERAIEAEKGVILREMEEVEKATEEVIFDRLHMTAFRDCSLGYTILGPVENIEGMKKKHLEEYVNSHYTPDRMVIAAAGSIDHHHLVKLAEEKLGKIHARPKSVIVFPGEKPFFCGSEIIQRNDEMGPIAHIAVAYEGVPWKSPDAIAFMLMQSIIGSYRKHDEGLVPGKISGNRTTNNLANRLGEGAAEAYSAFNTCYKDTGLFGFYCQAQETAVEVCVTDIMFGITSLAYTVTEEEVQSAKLQLLTLMMDNMDSTTAVAEDIGRQLLVYGRRMSIPEFIKRLDVIDAEEIKRLAWKYFHDRDVACAALGPLYGMPDYVSLRRQTYWMRY